MTEALREAIASLELQPGAALDKTALTRRFGVSRFPIAEALNRLKAEGLVDIVPQSGTRVSLIRLSDVRENMFLRRALEAEVAEMLAMQGDAMLIEVLRRNMRYQQTAVDAGDRVGFHRLDVEFHDILFAAVEFPRIRVFLETARLSLDRARRMLSSPRRHAVTFDEHQRIVDAMEARDGQAARRAMAAHIDAVMEELEALYETRPEIFADAGLR